MVLGLGNTFANNNNNINNRNSNSITVFPLLTQLCHPLFCYTILACKKGWVGGGNRVDKYGIIFIFIFIARKMMMNILNAIVNEETWKKKKKKMRDEMKRRRHHTQIESKFDQYLDFFFFVAFFLLFCFMLCY